MYIIYVHHLCMIYVIYGSYMIRIAYSVYQAREAEL